MTTESKFCASCGKQITLNSEMCPHCGTVQGPASNTDFSSKAGNFVSKYGIVFGVIISIVSIIGGLVCWGGEYMNGLGNLPFAIGIYFIAKGIFMGTLVILTAIRKG